MKIGWRIWYKLSQKNYSSAQLNLHSNTQISQKFNLKSMLRYFDDIDDLREKYINVCNNETLNDEEKEIYHSLFLQIDTEYGKTIYKSGQRPCIGTYTCVNCNQEITLDNRKDILPPCPNCTGTKFFKVNLSDNT